MATSGLYAVTSDRKKKNDFSVYRISPEDAAVDKVACGWQDGVEEDAGERTGLSYSGMVAVGPKLYVIGGFGDHVNNADRVLIFHLDSESLSQGPPLKAGKSSPYVFCMDNRTVVAISSDLFDNKLPSSDPSPYVETLDTVVEGAGWNPLPDPPLPRDVVVVGDEDYIHDVLPSICELDACVGGFGTIFLSVADLGTYSYNVTSGWSFNMKQELPFVGMASSSKDDDDGYLFYGFVRDRGLGGGVCIFRLEAEDTDKARIAVVPLKVLKLPHYSSSSLQVGFYDLIFPMSTGNFIIAKPYLTPERDVEIVITEYSQCDGTPEASLKLLKGANTEPFTTRLYNLVWVGETEEFCQLMME